jgi:hypothetical protein
VLHVLQDFTAMTLPNILQIVLLELIPLVLAQTDKVFQLVSMLVLYVQQALHAWVDRRPLLVFLDTTAMPVMAFARFAQLATDAQTLLSNRFSVNLANIINQAELHALLVSKDIFALIQH